MLTSPIVCTPCSRRKGGAIKCTWEGGDSRTTQISPAEILKLQNRLKELESGLNRQGSGEIATHCEELMPPMLNAEVNAATGLALSRTRVADDVDEGLSRVTTGIHSSPYLQPSGRPRLNGPSVSPSARPVSSSGGPASTGSRALNTSASAMIGPLPADAASNEFFGGSSAGSFINQVRRAVKGKMTLPEPRSGTGNPDASDDQIRFDHQLPWTSAPDIVLPARSRADQLLNIYWDIVHVLYPFVDKHETMRKYQSLFDGQVEYESDQMFVCLLNVIFALSCQLSGAIEARRRESSAKVYYQRAKEFLDLWTTSSFQTVQVYLLLGQYFQSTNESHQCWMAIGAAIRTAQSLGLHFPETTERTASLRTRELTRKVWHGCVIMDRVVSMTYGRPPMIAPTLADAVPRPLPIEEQYLSHGAVQSLPQGTPSILDFFLQTIELYDILSDVLINLYSPASVDDQTVHGHGAKHFGRSGPDDNALSSLSIESRLVRWESGLPPHLKLDTTNQYNAYFTRQAVILHQR